MLQSAFASKARFLQWLTETSGRFEVPKLNISFEPGAGALAVLLAALLLATGTTASGDDIEGEKVNWKENFSQRARAALVDVEEMADVGWRRFANRMGFHQPRHIMAYRGYSDGDQVYVKGRLLANSEYGGPSEDDGWWDNIKATYERWETDEIPDASMTLRFADQQRKVTTDEEGYYEGVFAIDPGLRGEDIVTARHRVDDRNLQANHRVFVPSPDAEYIVISDVDDTIIHTQITELLTAAQLTFLNNAKTRKPLTGAASLYRALVHGQAKQPVNPIFYVSNSAWNMYDLLEDFLELNDFPFGPLMLRDLGLGTDSSNHKPETFSTLIEQFPDLSVVLIGDSGQHDADYYATVAESHPGRVAAIYIRDVDPDDDSEYDGKVDEIIERTSDINVPFLRVGDSTAIAEHAIELGLLPDDVLTDIETDTDRDRQRDTLQEEAATGDAPAPD